ncbi:hypothetical protein G6M26_06515 [Agrobacterium tumefaciens]|nr:hypothetical protein [Agrobacterium tumefaciens]NTE18170.1 hypothetical protein [Agrobacterium tumefaciens]
MRAFYLIIGQLFLLFSVASAQRIQTYFDSDNYAHTINRDQYKIVFHVMPYGEQPGTIKHDRRYAWFGGNQLHLTQGGFSGRLLHGPYVEHFETNVIKSKGAYQKGLADGEWKIWRNDGSLDSVLVYSSGILNGMFERYDTAGFLLESGQYKNGKLNGKIKRWLAKDSLQIIQYKKGKLYSKRPSKATIILNKWLPWKKKKSAPSARIKKE